MVARKILLTEVSSNTAAMAWAMMATDNTVILSACFSLGSGRVSVMSTVSTGAFAGIDRRPRNTLCVVAMMIRAALYSWSSSAAQIVRPCRSCHRSGHSSDRQRHR